MFPLIFTTPWILALLAGLPLLWRILRAAPPPPRTVRFPGVFFLYGLHSQSETPGVTPWWLLLMRTLLVMVLILAASDPVWRGQQDLITPPTRPLVVVVDNSAMAAPIWPRLLDAASMLIRPALATQRPVIWVGLTPEAGDGTRGGTLPHGRLDSRSWERHVRTLTPQPWLADPRAVSRILDTYTFPEPPEIWLVSSGVLPRPWGEGWLARLAEGGADVHVLVPPPPHRPHAALTDLVWDGETAHATVTMLPALTAGTSLPVHVMLQDRQGQTLATAPALPDPAGLASSLTATIRLPAEQAAMVRQARIAGESSLAGLWLTHGGWGAPPVGLLSRKPEQETQSLLDELHYLRQAVGMTQRTVTGSLSTLLTAGSRVILWPDAVVLNAQDRARIADFVGNGGVLVRFAGETLAGAGGDDPLLPVRLRPGKRALGGTLGEAPPRLVDVVAGMPLAGLDVPQDVTVTAQVLPVPVADLPTRVWARLGDGTPLVTGTRKGRGWLVLFTTSATPVWSTLVYSSVFPAMLDQLAQLGNGEVPTPDTDTDTDTATARLPLWRMLDARGQLVMPPPGARALPHTSPRPDPGPDHPPGLYGEGGRVALNLGPTAAARLAAIETLWTGRITTSLHPERRLAPGLLVTALVLMLLDGVAMLMLGHSRQAPGRFWQRPRSGAKMGAVVMVLVHGLSGSLQPAFASPATAPRPDPATGKTFEFLAYLPSGDATVDAVTAAGLAGLTQAITHRTAAELAPPRRLAADAPDLPLAPLVYWALGATPPQLSTAEREGLRAYLRHDGLLFIDTRSAPRPAEQAARMRVVQMILADLGVAEVAPVGPDHILTRTFYLVDRFPGRWTAGTLATPPVSQDDADPVAPVIVGSNDYAAAWAINAAGNPLVPVLSQGAQQREQAVRAGVNVVLYALTGTYKNDQIHLQTILERLE